MNEPIIIENNSGFFAMLGKVLSNRAFLGIAVVLLGGWHFYRWWWQEDVCLQRYQRADKAFIKQNKRTNTGIEKGIKGHLVLDQRAEKARAGKLRESRRINKQHKTDAIIPKAAHRAIHEVR